VRLIPDPSAGFDDDTQARIRSAAEDVLLAGSAVPVVDDPGPERFQQMMSTTLGEHVPDEYVAMMRADMGFESAEPSWSDAAPSDPPHVLIVGAGVSGLCLAQRLDRLGVPFTIVDKNDEVGGTWWENRYPGCGVDTPNHFYSYSFRPNPGWRRFFSLRDELVDYLRDAADEFGVRDRLRLGTAVVAARWDDAAARWHVTVRDGTGETDEIDAAVVVCATGHFNRPRLQFPGDDVFAGDVFHTSRWPADVDMAGRNVVVIGTGASSMQTVTTIVGEVASLTVVQRTPQWVREVPEYTLPVDPAGQWLFEHVPYYGEWYRFNQFWRYGDGLLRYLRKDPDWPEPARALNRTNDRHRAEMTAYIERQLDGRPDLLAACIPTYPAFGKRILIDNGWFAALRQPHVRLVEGSVTRLERDGVRLADGTLLEADTVVLAVGFDVTELASHIDVVGRDGRRLADDWADSNPTAYLGMAVPKFPNFFVMYGPNTNVGHGGSGMWLAETQTRYVTGCIVALAESGAPSIEVSEAARREYTEEIDRLHEDLIWTHPDITTYYRNANGQVRSPMPYRLVDYWHFTRRPDLS
ncbi:MAG TPA: NAD(P)/FAD-dependent oxidoreductase, partial [Ilumatobacteraceae bacterium]|nr:NAD(P)/FAD-dependent oxidoreductase [Ilumatobacteraceae bacterium]